MKPKMIVIAGPSGSGKSRCFAARRFGIAYFNVDDRCAELTRAAYEKWPDEPATFDPSEWAPHTEAIHPVKVRPRK